ncbi:MAG TPA: ATP-binding cassette domain-containing protein [Candidatus Krumholzibacteria bacterium]|nr:ATP-binding cassette domain-containing protein [Candidatus Krumholzibacteria bacterium]
MIEVHDVSVELPGRPQPVLDGVSFRLQAGERVALLGGNGSGKTTLARLLNGTVLPSRGRVLVHGFDTRDPSARFEVRRHVGLLFQDPDHQFVTTTVEREIAFGLENLNEPTPRMHAAVRGALEDFDLRGREQAPPHEMSGGEKARLALACVWVMGPSALVLDETDCLLDRRSTERLWRQVDDLPADTALLRVTTDAELAASSPRVLVLHEGRLVAEGPPDAVFAHLPPEVVARVGLPLVWRLAEELVRAGRLHRATVSLDRVLTGLGVPGPGGGAA